MKLFKELNSRGHEQISFFNDTYSGLKGIVAIHNTTLGPALGGCLSRCIYSVSPFLSRSNPIAFLHYTAQLCQSQRIDSSVNCGG